MTTALFLLRTVQMGLRLDELDGLGYGTVLDMMVESGNDEYKYDKVATQEDIDRW